MEGLVWVVEEGSVGGGGWGEGGKCGSRKGVMKRGKVVCGWAWRECEVHGGKTLMLQLF